MTWSLAAVGLALVFSAILALRLRHSRASAANDPLWIEELSLERYRPMERLLEAADYAFLTGQAGCRSGVTTSLRRQRRQIMRCYLRRLCADFRRIQSVARLRTANSAGERHHLPIFLAKQTLMFRAGVLTLEAALAFDALGGFVAVDVRPLLRSAELLLTRARQLGQAA